MSRGREATHGMTGTKIYRIWINMRNRCSNVNAKWYHRYGGRGITVCNEWASFESFLEWALSNGYKEDVSEKGLNKISLDRIDNCGDYSPNNCRWVSWTTQQRNKGLHCNNTSGHKGICWEPNRRKWKVAIMANKVLKNVGRFDNLNDAINARKQAEIDLWGA